MLICSHGFIKVMKKKVKLSSSSNSKRLPKMNTCIKYKITKITIIMQDGKKFMVNVKKKLKMIKLKKLLATHYQTTSDKIEFVYKNTKLTDENIDLTKLIDEGDVILATVVDLNQLNDNKIKCR